MSDLVVKQTRYRTCTHCGGRTIGARSRKCIDCGSPFPVKSPSVGDNTRVDTATLTHYPVMSQLPPDYSNQNIHTIVVVPNKSVPVNIPTNFKYSDILSWVQEVRAIGVANGEFFTRQALLVFGRQILKGSDFTRFSVILGDVDDPAPLIESDTIQQDS